MSSKEAVDFSSILSDEQRYKEAFYLFDRDCDGKLTTEELAEAIRALGNPLSTEKLKKFVDSVDSNKDGALNMEEFITYMKQWKHSLSHDKDVLEAFRAFDDRNEGFIPSEKFRKWMTTLGSRPLSKQEADEFVELASAGGHDFDYEKFLTFMESHVAKAARAPRKSIEM